MLSALGLFYRHLEDVLTQLTRRKHFTMVAGGRNCKSAEVEVYKCFDVKLLSVAAASHKLSLSCGDRPGQLLI